MQAVSLATTQHYCSCNNAPLQVQGHSRLQRTSRPASALPCCTQRCKGQAWAQLVIRIHARGGACKADRHQEGELPASSHNCWAVLTQLKRVGRGRRLSLHYTPTCRGSSEIYSIDTGAKPQKFRLHSIYDSLLSCRRLCRVTRRHGIYEGSWQDSMPAQSLKLLCTWKDGRD